MKISIIVPIYNTSKYLTQCLQSIQNQTFKDFEVLCINDGSTDESLSIISEFVQNDSRFKLIDKKNTGYGHSMNLGIQQAQGDYIGIVESDDYIAIDMLEKLYKEVQLHDVEVVKADFYEVLDQGELNKRENLCELPIRQLFAPLDQLRTFCIHPSIWTSLYKKSFLLENKISFLETPGASFQDISFSFKVLICAKKVICIDDAVMYYRVSNMDSSIHSPKKIFCICDELDEIVRFANERFEQGKEDILVQNRVQKVIDRIRYANYLWTYERIPYEYKYAFLDRTNMEFQKIDDESIENEMWEQPAKDTFYRIKYDMGHYFSDTTPAQLDDRLQYYNLLNEDLEVIGFETLTEKYESIIIYGAGVVGKEVCQYLINKGLKSHINAFLVTYPNDNVEEIEGIPVIALEHMDKEKLGESLILISVVYEKHHEMVSCLKNYDASHILVISNKMREHMRSFQKK